MDSSVNIYFIVWTKREGYYRMREFNRIRPKNYYIDCVNSLQIAGDVRKRFIIKTLYGTIMMLVALGLTEGMNGVTSVQS